jgi:uncharacterized membrane protein
MAIAWTTGSAATAPVPVIRRIGLPDLRLALHRGVEDFLATPTQLIFLCVLYPIVGLVVARMMSGGDTLDLLFPLVAGLSLVGPVAAVGLYEISRRREAGKPASWLNAFDVLRDPAFLSIAGVGLLLTVVFVAWLAAARAVFGLTIGAVPDSFGALAHAVFQTSEGHRLILLGNLVGFGFAVLVLVLTVVSVPMLLDRNVPVATALQTSVRACVANPVPMAAWGLIVVGLLVLGSLPAFIGPVFVGLAVVMPVLGHATWHLYRRVVG